MWTPPERIRHSLPAESWPTAKAAEQSLLFSPLTVGSVKLQQRTWVPAMVPWRATADGFVNDDVIAWYERFARGRPGAIVVEATGIRELASGPLLRIGDDRFVPGLRRLTEAVRQASRGQTKLFIQLIDFLTVRRRVTANVFFERFFVLGPAHRRRLVTHTGDPNWQAADETRIQDLLAGADDALINAVLTTRECEDLRQGYRQRITDTGDPSIAALPQTLPSVFAEASERAKEAGFDGVELHYAHAYTMSSFLSRTNTRSDGYGGNLKGRLRLPLEVLAAVRERVGTEYCVGCRMLGDEVITNGTHPDEASEIAVALASGGLDFVSVSKGGKFEDAAQPAVGQAAYPYTGPSGYECMPSVYSDAQGPFARNLSLAVAIRSRLREAKLPTPVVTAGGICTFSTAEAILQRGDADIIAAARQSLADPDWFLKMRTGDGEAIRRCKYTNYCEALDTRHKQVTCQRWDRVDLDEPDIALSHDGRRRLIAPAWSR